MRNLNMLSIIGIETAFLTVARFSLFFACRKYLLRILYSNLASLSTPTASGSSSHALSRSPTPVLGHASIELETLPPPTTQTPRSSQFVVADPTYLHASVSRGIFSWCFAESCMLFLLLMLQGWGLFSSRSRLLNWRFSLLILVCCILVVIPLAFSLLLSLATTPHPRNSRNHFFSFRTIFALATMGLYLFALSYVPVPSSLQSSGTFSTYLSRLVVIGTVILGLLSGFGAISSSWQFLPTSEPQTIPSEQDLDTAQYALTSVRNDIQQRRADAARREETVSDGSLVSRVGSSLYGSNALEQELLGLQALEYQMSRNLEGLRERHEGAKYGRTLKGKVFNAFGRLIAAYCVIRIVSSVYNVIFLPIHRASSSRTYPDLLTNLLFFLYAHIWSGHSTTDSQHEKLAAVARQISLLLVGMIIFTSLRVVLKGVARALRITSRNKSISLLLLLLAQIMAIYLLSTLVQMRSSFPPSSSPEDETENLFTTIPAYEVFGSLFDGSFLLAAGASSLVRWTMERLT